MEFWLKISSSKKSRVWLDEEKNHNFHSVWMPLYNWKLRGKICWRRRAILQVSNWIALVKNTIVMILFIFKKSKKFIAHFNKQWYVKVNLHAQYNEIKVSLKNVKKTSLLEIYSPFATIYNLKLFMLFILFFLII